MGFLDESCTFSPFTEDLLTSCKQFDCGHSDLNDFFTNDCINYSKELFGKTYCFRLDSDPTVIVCAFTISNDSIRTNLIPKAEKRRLNKKVTHVKQKRSYPAVLIGRLGVNKDFWKNKVGSELMDFIKAWFIDEKNKTGCRFIVVDSYNEDIPLSYYSKNGFIYLFGNDIEKEKEFVGISIQQESAEATSLGEDDSSTARTAVESLVEEMSASPEEVKLNTRLMYFDLIILK